MRMLPLHNSLDCRSYQRLVATWRSGDAADCKSAYPGSIPGVASNFWNLLPLCYPIVPAEHKTCAERSRKQPRVAVTRNRILIGFVMVLVLACAVAVMAVMAVTRFSGLF